MILRQLVASVMFLLALPLVWGTALVGSWAADREIPVSVRKVVALPPLPRPGERLRIELTVFRSRSCSTHADRWLVDSKGNKEFLPDVDTKEAPGAVGDEEPTINTFTVPDYFEPGPARYVVLAQYQCNPTHWFFPLKAAVRETEFVIARR